MNEAERQWRTQREEFERYAREILDLVPTGMAGRLLDVGCGLGWVVTQANKRGFRATGIDKKRAYVETGKRFLGADLKNVSLEKFVSKQKFNAVILKHVLEHITDPQPFLAKIKTLLEPGGYLIVACPNIQSLMFWIFRSRWYGLHSGEHKWQFTPKLLSDLLTANGFTVEKIRINNMGYHVMGWKSIIFSAILAVANLTNLGDQVMILVRKGERGNEENEKN